MSLVRTHIDFFLVTTLCIFSKGHGQNSGTQDGFVGASDIFNGASVIGSAMLDQSSAAGEFAIGFPDANGAPLSRQRIRVDVGPQGGDGDIAQSRSRSMHVKPPPTFFHGDNVHHASGSPTQVSAFVDLTGGIQAGPGNVVAVNDVEVLMPVVSQAPTNGFSNSGGFDGFIQGGSSGLPWEQPSQPAENKLPPGIAFMGGSSGTPVGQTLGDTRTGNRRRPAFVETEIPVAGKPRFNPGASNLGNVINQGTFPSSNVHIDMPGQHGNTGGTAVVHRDGFNTGANLDTFISSVDMPAHHGNTAIPMAIHNGNGQPNSVGGVHIDMPGEHGNTGPLPVVHRQPFNPTENVNQGPSIPAMNVFVDQPGVHGNTAGIALVNRARVNPGAVLNPGGPSQGFIGSVHVDLPGEHGNTGNVPVIHRDTGSAHVLGTQPIGTVHIDLPGEHGNSANIPIVHREHVPPRTQSPTATGFGRPIGSVNVQLPGTHENSGPLMGGVHVDMPGQHGNPGNLPVVHREGTGSFSNPGVVFQSGAQFGGSGFPPLSNVHVDMPGEHGNQGNAPVNHIEGVQSSGPFGISGVGFQPRGQLGGPVVPNVNVHVDMPGEHGNQGHAAVVHREGTLRPGPFGAPGVGFQPRPQLGGSGVLPGNVHIDRPREHGNPGQVAVVHREDFPPTGPLPGRFSPLAPEQDFHPRGPFGGGTGIPRDRRPVGVRADRSGAHVKFAGEHGDPLTGHSSRVQPFGGHRILIGPVVATGVLPGTPNVPVPPRRPFGGRVRDRRIQLDAPGHVGSDIVDYRAERGGRRGRPEQDPSAPAPTNPGSGITVVQVRRQNPLGGLGDVMRSAFGIGSGNPIGLLGSLPNSAANVQPTPLFRPPHGMRQLVPVRRIQTPSADPVGGLIQSIIGNLFGG